MEREFRVNAHQFLQFYAVPPLAPHDSEHDSSGERALDEALANARLALVRRRQRTALFGSSRLADGPAWEMLIDLYIHHLQGKQLCIGAVCIISDLPMTNAVRILGRLLDANMVCRDPDPDDRRRCFIRLHPETLAGLHCYFAST